VNRRAAVEVALTEALPQVPSVFLSESSPAEWEEVEAALVGSLMREARGWDPRTAPRLRFVQRVFTGVDDLPFDRFPPSVEIAGNVGGYAPFVAEHAVALALGAARSLITAHAQVGAGRLRPPPSNRTLWGGTAVILGFGEIGREVAARLRPFGMRIVGVNRTGTAQDGADAMYPADRIRDAVALGRLIVDARPLTRATARSIGASELAAMPDDAIFVNVGRAGTVDEDALFAHLQRHPSFRAGLDVWWEEGFADGSLPLRRPWTTLPNLIATPHSAGFAPPVERYALDRACANLARFFAGERPLHVVDRSEYGRTDGPA